MSKRIVLSAQLSIGGNDITNQVNEFTFEATAAEGSTTNMASAGGWEEMIGALKSYQISFTLKKDSTFDFDGYTWTNLGAAVAWTGQPQLGAPSGTNPLYGGNVIVSKHTPISGSPGDVHGAQYTFKGTGAPTRATS